ncbi:MAG TPA: DUF4058 family protein [Gemmataceae bacterium]|nr:DUF4058 family protein [Gemmataceae bacterium]
MPIHDWTRVEAGIFHAFHHDWITEIARTLNNGLLPEDYYALPEQQAAGFGPDVLTLQSQEPAADSGDGPATTTLTRPKASFMAQSDGEFYRRKKKSIAIRHVSDDRIVAIVEAVSPGNKASRNAFREFVQKACHFLELKIHLLLLDLFPATKRDPHGIHAAIWGEIEEDSDFVPLPDKPLTLVAYESALVVRAFVETVAVGDVFPDMPLILEPGAAVSVPLEETYQRAYAAFPRRWRRVLEARAP